MSLIVLILIAVFALGGFRLLGRVGFEAGKWFLLGLAVISVAFFFLWGGGE